MKNNIYFLGLYNVSNVVFCLGEDGAKSYFDPIAKKKCIYGSSNSVKRNIKSTYFDNMGKAFPTVNFFKKIGEKEDRKGAQASMETENRYDPSIALGGSWNPLDGLKSGMKGVYNVSDFKPLHPYLVSSMNSSGTCQSTNNSKVFFLDKDSNRFTFDEYMAQFGAKISDKDKEDLLKSSTLTNNIYEDKGANGLYYYTVAIDMSRFGKVDVTGAMTEKDKATIQSILDNGGKYSKDGCYVMPNMDEIIRMWVCFVDALLNWEFQTNKCNHGSVNEPLRFSYSVNNVSLWQQATTTELVVNENGDEDAKVVLRDDIDGVHSFNTTLLSKYVDTSNVMTDVQAVAKARESLINDGVALINSYYND